MKITDLAIYKKLFGGGGGGGGSSILPQILDRSITRVTKEDLAGAAQIGLYAFYNCTELASIEIPDSVTSIREYAFYNCMSFDSIEIPDSVTSIGQYAFFGSGLNTVTIGSGIKSIGSDAFSYCWIRNLYVHAIDPPTLSAYMFDDGCPNEMSIYVPAASVDAYKSASGWSEYADRIVGM